MRYLLELLISISNIVNFIRDLWPLPNKKTRNRCRQRLRIGMDDYTLGQQAYAKKIPYSEGF